MFNAINPNRTFQDIVDQIQNAILSGKLAPGEKLLPDRELKLLFSISSDTLRAVLGMLEKKGLIEILQGGNQPVYTVQAATNNACADPKNTSHLSPGNDRNYILTLALD